MAMKGEMNEKQSVENNNSIDIENENESGKYARQMKHLPRMQIVSLEC
jgi:surface antigen